MEEEIIADLELSYLPAELINTSGCPPVIIANDRQLHNFVRFVQKSASTRLCVTCKAKAENPNKEAFDLNKPPADPCTHEEKGNSFDNGDESAPVYAERQGNKKNEKRKGVAVALFKFASGGRWRARRAYFKVHSHHLDKFHRLLCTVFFF
ncbi:hypothetical protein F2Q68_00019709 [Brassica cretica]|nr:hypothetical protein F2Q68_00019709 [Brassica cretica]